MIDREEMDQHGVGKTNLLRVPLKCWAGIFTRVVDNNPITKHGVTEGLSHCDDRISVVGGLNIQGSWEFLQRLLVTILFGKENFINSRPRLIFEKRSHELFVISIGGVTSTEDAGVAVLESHVRILDGRIEREPDSLETPDRIAEFERDVVIGVRHIAGKDVRAVDIASDFVEEALSGHAHVRPRSDSQVRSLDFRGSAKVINCRFEGLGQGERLSRIGVEDHLASRTPRISPLCTRSVPTTTWHDRAPLSHGLKPDRLHATSGFSNTSHPTRCASWNREGG